MFVYRFKFDEVTVNSGLTLGLLKHLESLLTEDEDIFNYLPSKLDIIVGVQESIYDKIIDWVRNNVTYRFEFEEHSLNDRTLTQIDPQDNPMVHVAYLLPLFHYKSYLKL